MRKHAQYVSNALARNVLSVSMVSMLGTGVAAYQPLPLAPADCSLRDGTEVRFIGIAPDDISLAKTIGNGSTAVLAFPETRRGLTVVAQSYDELDIVVGQLRALINSTETFTLSDVAATFDPEKYGTEIGFLSPDFVRCLTKDN